MPRGRLDRVHHLDHPARRLSAGHRPQALPHPSLPGLAPGPVGGQGGEIVADGRLAGVARREGGVVHGPPFVEIVVDVARLHAHVAQLQQVQQHAIELVDRRRAGVDRHLGVGPHGTHDIGGQHVPGQQVVEDAERVGHGHTPPRRAGALDPAHEGDDVGLVDRDPVRAIGGQRRQNAGDVAGEHVGRAGAQPELLAQPPRVAEVVQRDDRLEPTVTTQGEDLGVALEGGVVELAGARLQAGPFDGEPEGIAPDGSRPVECLGRVSPEVAGDAGALGAPRELPARPVVVRLAVAVEPALDLVAGGGDPGQEVLTEQAHDPGGP